VKHAPEQPPPQKRRRWRRWAALAAFLSIGAAIFLVPLFTREAPLDRLKRQIREEVPLGSTRAQVEAWAKRRLGRTPSIGEPPPEQYRGRTMPEAAGVPWSDLGSFMEVTVPAGWYTVNGQVAQNNLWVYFILNDAGEVVDYHFLTLEELAQIEKQRAEKK
jgi:hypothetical protein